MSEGLHGIAVYNPALCSDAELKYCFVARRRLLDRIIDDIRREGLDSIPQHQLVLGLRGMGKTALLRRIAIAVREDPELNETWLPLTFPEEQYNVAKPGDLWANCLDALVDLLEKTGNLAEAARLDEIIDAGTDDDPLGKGVYDLLIASAGKINKRLLLLIDNIDLVLDRLKNFHWAVREVLQTETRLLVIGASCRAMEATYRYEAAFYDFFKVHEIKSLTRQETHAVLKRLGEFEKSDRVLHLLQHDPARISALHTLTGGNPRTIVLLFKVLSQGLDGDVRSDLEGLLDLVTPLYKARFEELSDLSQQLVGVLALNWDPMLAREIADRLNMRVNQVSAQLARLENNGVVEKVAPARGKRTAFQISERFFNIWYLMRASRRVRKKLIWLVYFLKIFFTPQELYSHASGQLKRKGFHGPRRAEYFLALAQTTSTDMAWALEHQALCDLRQAGCAEWIDADPAYASKNEYLKKINEIREIARKNLMMNGHDPEQTVKLLLGDPRLLLNEKESIAKSFSSQGIEATVLTIGLERYWQDRKVYFGEKHVNDLYDAIETGLMKHGRDMKGAKSASIKYDDPVLHFLAMLYGYYGESADNIVMTDDCREAMLFAQKLFPDKGWPIIEQAEMELKEKGGIDLVKRLLEKATKMEPNNSSIWNDAGVLYRKMVDYNNAELAYEKAEQLDPKNQIPFINMGIMGIRLPQA